jgi:hypothetical protein
VKGRNRNRNAADEKVIESSQKICIIDGYTVPKDPVCRKNGDSHPQYSIIIIQEYGRFVNPPIDKNTGAYYNVATKACGRAAKKGESDEKMRRILFSDSIATGDFPCT